LSAATAKFVRALATLVQIAKDPEPIYAAVQSNFQLLPKALITLRNRVAKAEPLIDLKGIIKPVNFEGARVILHSAAPKAPNAAQQAENVQVLAAMQQKAGQRKPRAARAA
jgi:hypothetical protein